MKFRIFLLAFCMILGARALADEIHLKDGSKIVGTIVGFEDGAFRVETEYGFAVVRKESIAQIIPQAAPARSPAAAATSQPMPAPRPVERRAPAPVMPPRVIPIPATRSAAAPSAGPASTSAATAASSANADASLAAAPSAPPLPGPPVVREDVEGNLYINHTYGFQMYKPPSWRLIEDARRALPNAVAALGTPDESALLIIGRDAAHASLEAHAEATDRELRAIYSNYRPVSSRRAMVAGEVGIERRFRGVADDRDWSVTAITLARGNDVYTILGMIYGTTDLIQIRENVLARTIASIEFADQP